jgi:NADH-quinone oxidoreductase subunit J
VTFETVFTYLLGGAFVASALLVITRRSPVIAALYLVLNFFVLAGLYLTLNAQFVAVIQVLVYAGAIMVLFLFVIMLLNLGDEERLTERISLKKMLAVGLSFGLLMELVYIFGYLDVNLPDGDFARGVEIGTVEHIGKQLFTEFLFPFEITGILLLAAIVGAVVLAKKRIGGES